MKQIVLNKDNSSAEFLYEQLYKDIKKQILSGDMIGGEKCPSLRMLSENLGVSITTVMESYNQLLAEGYIKNKPGSGYFVEKLNSDLMKNAHFESIYDDEKDAEMESTSPYLYDEEAFDFIKWKKCASKVFVDNTHELLFGSDLRGEYSLREEISKYLFQSRGVKASPQNIIIAAGTQQIAFHLGRILKKRGIDLVSVEKPGYAPVKSMFEDAGFKSFDIPVLENGIDILKLPVNISSAVYVNPSNQFPTGVVMPAGIRYEILKWADENDSFIIEDDYNSELRYIGKPLPTIKSLDKSDRVVYLGSFSSTLFSAIKISYMVLPKELSEIFDGLKKNYSQTCSKAEQLTLAEYMKEGYYYTAIRKKRALFTKKLAKVEEIFEKYNSDNASAKKRDKLKIQIANKNSGLFITVRVTTQIEGAILTEVAKALRVMTSYIDEISDNNEKYLSVYYSYIPLESIEKIMESLLTEWNKIEE